jgi:hypothetical protein
MRFITFGQNIVNDDELIGFLTDIDVLILPVIESLMDEDPDIDSPKGKLLRALAEAVAAYENYLFPDLVMKVIIDE